MTERDLLVLLCHFISTKQIVQGDEGSIKDMVIRYKSPPFTLAYPVCIRMSNQDANQLNELLKQAHELLTSTEITPLSTPQVILDDEPPP